MAKKKSDKDSVSEEQRELERRVDAMMSVERPSSEAPPDSKPDDGQTVPPAADPEPTAPKLPAKLLKTITVDNADKPKAKPAKTEPTPDPPDPDDPPPERIIKLHVKKSNDMEALPEIPAVASDDPPPLAPATDPLADTETDKAVDDIVASEADLQLAVDDAKARRHAAEADTEDRPGFLASFFKSPWTWLFIIGAAWVAYAWFH
jgi:hypothetical protein